MIVLQDEGLQPARMFPGKVSALTDNVRSHYRYSKLYYLACLQGQVISKELIKKIRSLELLSN